MQNKYCFYIKQTLSCKFSFVKKWVTFEKRSRFISNMLFVSLRLTSFCLLKEALLRHWECFSLCFYLLLCSLDVSLFKRLAIYSNHFVCINVIYNGFDGEFKSFFSSCNL